MPESSVAKSILDKVELINSTLEDLNSLLLTFNDLKYILDQYKVLDKTEGTTNLYPSIPDGYYEKSAITLKKKIEDLESKAPLYRGKSFPLTDRIGLGHEEGDWEKFSTAVSDYWQRPVADLIKGEDFPDFVEKCIIEIKKEKQKQVTLYKSLSTANVLSKSEADMIFNVAFKAPQGRNLDVSTAEDELTARRRSAGKTFNDARKGFYKALANGQDSATEGFQKWSGLKVVTQYPYDQLFEEVKFRTVSKLFGNINRFCSITTQKKFDHFTKDHFNDPE